MLSSSVLRFSRFRMIQTEEDLVLTIWGGIVKAGWGCTVGRITRMRSYMIKEIFRTQIAQVVMLPLETFSVWSI